MLGHKISLNKFKEAWNRMKHLFWKGYETKKQLQEKNWKNTNMWRLDNMSLNNQWVNKEIKEKNFFQKEKFLKIYGNSLRHQP